MKTKLTIVAVLLVSGILLTGFIENTDLQEVKTDLINEEFPKEKKEVLETFGAIAQSIKIWID